jgi:hypothetical protein
MDRRGFLLAVTSATAIGAGCSTPLTSSDMPSLGDPSVNNPEDGTYYYNFEDDDGDSAVNVDVSIEPRNSASNRAVVNLSMGPQPKWDTLSLRFALRAPADTSSGDSPARVLLEIPDAGPYPPFSLHVTDDGYRVVDLSGLDNSDFSNRTIPLRSAVVPRENVESLDIRFTGQYRNPEDKLRQASFSDHLSMPITR